ncbi:caspase domain-containing protein [Streptomyces sp. NPDC057555]|uniref:caspase family protein n=1 Tax=Streptomyces sp. NPDC057555 TaxID=3346166 RepID=UPI0036C4BEAC
MTMDDSRHALVVTTDRYEDDGLKQLPSAAQDAVALAEVLGDPQIGAFDVQVVRNEPAHVITRRINKFFSGRRPSDTLLVHFSCHGIKSESGELYFASSDTEPGLLDSTAVAADFVRQQMSRTRAGSTILCLDCCYGGAFPRGVRARASGDVNVLESFSGENFGGGRGWAVMTASNSREYAFEDAQLAENRAKPSVFTSALYEGLKDGTADRDEDGLVSFDDAYHYVFDQVRRENPNQTPSCSADLQGDVYLARSRRRRIIPSPIPDDLRAATHNPDTYTRRGAIAELRARMENTDLSIALGAREALEEMAHNDIHFVAEEASRALGEISVKPYPTHLEFEPVAQHEPSPHQSVRLLGPPLARSCTPHPNQDWLRAVESSDGLDVSIETSAPGHLSGGIVLKGVVGEAVLHVEAQVLPVAETAPTAEPSVPKAPAAAPVAPELPPQLEEKPRPAPEHSPPAPPRPTPHAEREPRSRALRVPASAVVAVGLAVTSVVMAILAVVAAAGAIDSRVSDRYSTLDYWVGQSPMISYLVVCLITAVLALLLVALARRELRLPGAPYPKGTVRSIGSLTWTAKHLARPALTLAVLLLIAYLIAIHLTFNGVHV